MRARNHGPSTTPRPYVEGQLRAIVGVEIVIDRVEGKWKLSQNRSDADIEGAIEGLEATGNESVRSDAISGAADRHAAAGPLLDPRGSSIGSRQAEDAVDDVLSLQVLSPTSVPTIVTVGEDDVCDRDTERTIR